MNQGIAIGPTSIVFPYLENKVHKQTSLVYHQKFNSRS